MSPRAKLMTAKGGFAVRHEDDVVCIHARDRDGNEVVVPVTPEYVQHLASALLVAAAETCENFRN